MTFQGQLAVDEIYLPYKSNIYFNGKIMLTGKGNSENPGLHPDGHIPNHEEYSFPNRTPYQIEFLERVDTEKTYTDLRITFTGYDGRQHSGKIKVDKNNCRIAKWIHKKYFLSRHLSEIIVGIISGLVSGLLTWLFTCQC